MPDIRATVAALHFLLLVAQAASDAPVKIGASGDHNFVCAAAGLGDVRVRRGLYLFELKSP